MALRSAEARTKIPEEEHCFEIDSVEPRTMGRMEPGEIGKIEPGEIGLVANSPIAGSRIEPRNHILEPRSHILEPQSHRFEPRKHLLQILLLEPRDRAMTQANCAEGSNLPRGAKK